MNIKNYVISAQQAFMAAVLVLSLLVSTFFMVEPKIGQAVDSGPFTIKQTIDGEISFLVDAPNVVMSGSLNGVTGGTANGTSTAVVTTNSSTGYTMSIAFFDNAGDSAMYGDTTFSDAIQDYASTSEPSYGFSTASSAAVFAFTASADNTSDVDLSFNDDGSSCNSAGSVNPGTCWRGPTVSGFQIIDRSTSANTGATTTINFRVHVPNSPSPAVVTDTYTATATLTAVNQ